MALPRFMDLSRFQAGAATTARMGSVALGFSLPVSVALDNVLVALVLVAWALAGRWRNTLHAARHNPVALSALALFGLLALGLLYGSRNPGDGLHYLGKYADLLLFPVFIIVFRDEAARRRALTAFLAASGLILALSFAISLGAPSYFPLFKGDAANPVVFKFHITHGFLMAFAAFLFARLGLESREPRRRMALLLLAALAAYNVLFMVQGKTGYVVLLALLVYLFAHRGGWKGFAAGILLAAALGVSSYYFSDPFHARVSQAARAASGELAQHEQEGSVTPRIEFLQNSLEIVREHPLFGVGTGGFPRAYAEHAAVSGVAPTVNPHNDYLLIAVQTGIAGFALLLHLFYRQWRLAARLPLSWDRSVARGLVLVMAMGGLFNSLLLDHTEGLFFAWMSGLVFAQLGPAPESESAA